MMQMATVNTQSEEELRVLYASWKEAKFVDIPQQALEFVRQLFRSSACRAAHGVLTRHLFSGNMYVTGLEHIDDNEQERLRFLLNSAYPAFGAQFIADMKMYGFCIVSIDRKTLAPVALNPMEHRVQHRTRVNGLSEYRVLEQRGRTGTGLIGTFGHSGALDDIMVFECDAPDEVGRLTSAIMSLAHITQYMNCVMLCSAMGLARSSFPQVYETSEEKKISEQRMEQDQLEWGEASALAARDRNDAQQQEADKRTRNAEHAERRSTANRDRYQTALQALYGAGQAITSLTDTPAYTPELWQQLEPPKIPLPPNHSITAVPVPSPPMNVEEVKRQYNMEVSQVMGVPYALWGPHDRSIATDESALTLVYATEQSLRRDLKTVFELFLVFSFGDVALQARSTPFGLFEDGSDSEDETGLHGGQDATRGEEAGAAGGTGDRALRSGKRKGTKGTKGTNDDQTRAKQKLVSDFQRGRTFDEHEGRNVRREPAESTRLKLGMSHHDDGDAAGGDVGGTRGQGRQEAKEGEKKDDEQRNGPKRRRVNRKDLEGAVRRDVISISFPSLLDHTISQNLFQFGAIPWESYIAFTSNFYGIAPEHLCEEQLEPATQQVLWRQVMRTRMVEELLASNGVVDRLTHGSEDLRATFPNRTLGLPFTGAADVDRILRSKRAVDAERIMAARADAQKGGEGGGGGASGKGFGRTDASIRERPAGSSQVTVAPRKQGAATVPIRGGRKDNDRSIEPERGHRKGLNQK